MGNKEKTPYLHIQIGADGNPEIELGGSRTEVMGLCAAYLSSVMMAATNLLDRMEG